MPKKRQNRPKRAKSGKKRTTATAIPGGRATATNKININIDVNRQTTRQAANVKRMYSRQPTNPGTTRQAPYSLPSNTTIINQMPAELFNSSIARERMLENLVNEVREIRQTDGPNIAKYAEQIANNIAKTLPKPLYEPTPHDPFQETIHRMRQKQQIKKLQEVKEETPGFVVTPSLVDVPPEKFKSPFKNPLFGETSKGEQSEPKPEPESEPESEPSEPSNEYVRQLEQVKKMYYGPSKTAKEKKRARVLLQGLAADVFQITNNRVLKRLLSPSAKNSAFKTIERALEKAIDKHF